MSQSLIEQIENHMDKIGDEYDSYGQYGQAQAHERAVQILLPLLKKAIEQRDQSTRAIFDDGLGIIETINGDNKELLKLLGVE